MAQMINQLDYDVVVVGGGAAGVAASMAAAKNGAKVLLVEAGPMIRGEMLSGLPIDGCLSTRGEWVVGGIARELFDECDRLGGYVGHFYDWRTIWVVCTDPEIMKLAVVNSVRKAGVDMLLYTFAEDVVLRDGEVTGVVLVNKNQRTLVRAKVFIDASGDRDLAKLAGAPYETGNGSGQFQPVSLVFRMQRVDFGRLLNFVAEEPDNVAAAENPYYADIPRAEQIRRLVAQGYPKVFFVANGPLIRRAIADGDLHATALIGIGPVSMKRREIYCNTTRIADVDATRTDQLSRALPDLLDQVWASSGFLAKRVPGFETAQFSLERATGHVRARAGAVPRRRVHRGHKAGRNHAADRTHAGRSAGVRRAAARRCQCRARTRGHRGRPGRAHSCQSHHLYRVGRDRQGGDDRSRHPSRHRNARAGRKVARGGAG